MGNQSAAITLHKLSKRYRGAKHFSLNDVSLQVKRGEVYGFLGANGAGKSTTIRTILNFIQPSAGSATICGLDSVADSVAAKQHVGYLSGDVALYDKMSGRELLAYLGSLQPAKDSAYLRTLEADFQAQLDKPIKALSKGNRQKIGLLQALMHQPDVLILDEPTSGLDPLMQEVFFEHIALAKKRDAAVFLSSHNLGEVQRMCDRVGIIRDGSLIIEKTVDQLINTGPQRFTAAFTGDVPVGLSKYAKIVSKKAGLVVIETTGELAALLSFLGTHKIKHFASNQANLEDEFLQFYGDRHA